MTGKPGMLQSIGSQRVGHHLATKQQQSGYLSLSIPISHHQLDGHEFEQAPGDGDGQGSLVCCSPLGHKELDTTE